MESPNTSDDAAGDHESPLSTPSASVVIVPDESEGATTTTKEPDASLVEEGEASTATLLSENPYAVLESSASSPYMIPTSDLSEKEFDDLASVDSTISSESRGPPSLPHLPQVPDLRFNETFNKNVRSLQEQQKSPLYIFMVTIVRDQMVMPWLNGFAWGFGSHFLRWWRTSDASKKDTGYWKAFFARLNRTLR